MSERVLVVAVAGMLALLGIGISLEPLLTATYTRTLVRVVGSADSAELSADEVSDLSETVRAFVLGSVDALPETVSGGRTGFDEASVSHLLDVRAVIAGARFVTLAMLLAAVAVVAGCAVRRRWDLLERALKGAALVLVAGIVIAAAVALLSFDALFTAFHGLFFAPGTWTFPQGSLIIELFPVQFWALSGAAWGVLILAWSAVYAGAATVLRIRCGAGVADEANELDVY